MNSDASCNGGKGVFINLMTLKLVQIPRDVLTSTFDFLRKYGTAEVESQAIWVGKNLRPTTFKVSEVWFPKQYNEALSYYIPEEEVHRINVKLNDLGLTAVAQIHTHPSSAFHSCTDDDGPTLLLPGSFSIVIPDYGFVSKDDDFSCWAVYRFNGKEWRRAAESELVKIFQVI